MSTISEILTTPWLIAEIFTILILVSGYLISKYLDRIDNFTAVVTNLDKTIAILITKLNTLQSNDNKKNHVLSELISKVDKLKNAFIKLKTSVDICQTNNSCGMKENHDEIL